MKRFIVPVTLLILIICSSWGREGHSTVGLIAERHLTPQAKAAVNELLKGQSLSEVASWADQIKNRPGDQHTASWHFINVHIGLSTQQFITTIEQSKGDNLLNALENKTIATIIMAEPWSSTFYHLELQ